MSSALEEQYGESMRALARAEGHRRRLPETARKDIPRESSMSLPLVTSLAGKGLSRNEVAHACGVHPTSLDAWLKRRGLTLRDLRGGAA